MAELLIVLMMASTCDGHLPDLGTPEESVPKEDKEKDAGTQERVADIMGKSLFRMPERKPQAAASAPNAALQVSGEEVDEKDVAFDDEAVSPNTRPSGAKVSRQVQTRNWTRCLPTSVFQTSGRNMTKTGITMANPMKRAD